MRLLVDTHALLWFLAASPALDTEAYAALSRPEHVVKVSAASVWEVTIKQAAGKLNAPDDLVAAVEATGFEALPITLSHAARAGALPSHHRDPFDRMLVAQAQLDGLTVVTRDPVFERYGVALLPA